jgi:hypothetical protein
MTVKQSAGCFGSTWAVREQSLAALTSHCKAVSFVALQAFNGHTATQGNMYTRACKMPQAQNRVSQDVMTCHA